MMVATFRRLLADDSGATAIEYGLIAAMIAVAIIGSFTVLGNGLSSVFGTTQTGAGGVMERASSSIH